MRISSRSGEGFERWREFVIRRLLDIFGRERDIKGQEKRRKVKVHVPCTEHEYVS